MNRTFFAIGLIAVALLAAPIGVVAQETATTTTGANATTEATQTTSGASTGQNTVSVQLTDTLTLKSWTFEDGTFSITFHAKIPASVTVTDSGYLMNEMANGDDDSKTRDIPYEPYTLTSGTTTVKFDATVVDGEAAVTVGSTDSLKLLQTGSMSASSKPAISWQTVQLLLLGAVGLTAGITISVVRRKAEDEEKGAERIL